MTQRRHAAQAMIVVSVLNTALFVIFPILAVAHGNRADHADEGGVDIVTTLQVAGILAVLGLGYLVISRQASRREDDRHDRGI